MNCPFCLSWTIRAKTLPVAKTTSRVSQPFFAGFPFSPRSPHCFSLRVFLCLGIAPLLACSPVPEHLPCFPASHAFSGFFSKNETLSRDTSSPQHPTCHTRARVAGSSHELFSLLFVSRFSPFLLLCLPNGLPFVLSIARLASFSRCGPRPKRSSEDVLQMQLVPAPGELALGAPATVSPNGLDGQRQREGRVFRQAHRRPVSPKPLEREKLRRQTRSPKTLDASPFCPRARPTVLQKAIVSFAVSVEVENLLNLTRRQIFQWRLAASVCSLSEILESRFGRLVFILDRVNQNLRISLFPSVQQMAEEEAQTLAGISGCTVLNNDLLEMPESPAAGRHCPKG